MKKTKAILATVSQAVLAEEKIIQHGHLVAFAKKIGSHDGAEVACAAGD